MEDGVAMAAAFMRKIQCVVAAGGQGTRLRPLTDHLPKPMVPVLGIPFLHWLLHKISGFGVRRFLLLTGYLAGRVEDYFGNGVRWGWEIDYSREETPLGSGGALSAAREKLDELFLYVNGDDYPDVDYLGMARAFHGLPALAMVATVKSPAGKLRVEPTTGKVTEYAPRGGLPVLDCGTKLFRRDVLDLAGRGAPFDLEPELWPALIRAGTLYAYPIVCCPHAIDTPENLKKFEDWLRETRVRPPCEAP